MKILQYQFLLEAEQPIAHHSGTVGNMSLLMRRKTRQPDGSFSSVPAITADTMRHGLREAGAYAFLAAAKLRSTTKLSRAAIRLLFNGGQVSGRGSAGSVNLAKYMEMCELCPTLALLGGCADNRIVPGRLFVSDAQLVCNESLAFVPTWIRDKATPASARSHVEEVMRVRMDPLLHPEKQSMLTEAELAETSGQLNASSDAHESDSALGRAKSSMLPRSMEVIIQGARFFWEVTCNCLDEMDAHTLHTMISAFLASPVIGGKRATGHGKLRALMVSDGEAPIAWSSDWAPGATGAFTDHITARQGRVETWLSKVAA